MRSRKSSAEKSDIPCTASSNNHLHPDLSYDSGFSPPRRHQSRSPPSPGSAGGGGHCKCRKCSILHLEECEPKEMNALFKFLRKSKVEAQSFLISNILCKPGMFKGDKFWVEWLHSLFTNLDHNLMVNYILYSANWIWSYFSQFVIHFWPIFSPFSSFLAYFWPI